MYSQKTLRMYCSIIVRFFWPKNEPPANERYRYLKHHQLIKRAVQEIFRCNDYTGLTVAFYSFTQPMTVSINGFCSKTKWSPF